MKRLLLASALALGLASPQAHAASSAGLTITVSCPVSASFSLTPGSPWTVSGAYPTFALNYPNSGPVPVPANSLVAGIGLSPAGACVINPITGTNASSFAISGTNLVVGATALPAGTYTITISAP